MSTIFTLCDICKQDIHYGCPYVCLQRNIERAEHLAIKSNDEVYVIDSEAIITLCESCSKLYPSEVILKMIRAAD